MKQELKLSNVPSQSLTFTVLDLSQHLTYSLFSSALNTQKLSQER